MASAIFTPPAEFWQQFGELKDRLANVEYKLDKALAVNAALVSDAAKAADARAAAEKRAAIAQQLVEKLRAHHTKCNMDDDAKWDVHVDLQQQLDAASRELTELRQERDSLAAEGRKKDAEIERRGITIDQLKDSESSLERELAGAKDKLRQQISDTNDIRANLDSAYADLTNKDEHYGVLQKQKNAVDSELHAVRLELKDAHEHYQESQKRVEELESQKSAIEELELSNATLQADHDSLQAMLDDCDRTILVKDARILLLENQVQKAMAAERKAQDGAIQAESTSESSIEPVAAKPATELFATAQHDQSESLEADLGSQADADDFQGDSDRADLITEPEISLDYSEISIVDTTPVAAATATASAQTTISTSQTDTPSQTEDVQPDTKPSAVPSEANVLQLWDDTIEPVLKHSKDALIDDIVSRLRDLTQKTRATSSTQTEEESVDHQPLIEAITQTDLPNLVQTAAETIVQYVPVDSQSLLTEATTQTEAPELSQAVTQTVVDYALVSQSPFIEATTQTDSPELNQAVTQTVAEYAPVSQSPLVESTMQTDAPKLTQAATQTILHDAPVDSQLPLTEATTQTDPPKLTQAATETILQHAPTVYEERHVQTQTLPTDKADQAIQTDTPDEAPSVATADQDTQTDAQTETPRATLADQPTQTLFEARHIDMSTQTDPQPTPSSVATTPSKSHRKSSFFTWSTAFAIFFAWLSLCLYIWKEDWRLTNNRSGVNRLYNSMGYKRRGRHLFGAIPVCYQQHENLIFESMCEQFAIGVAKLEAYAGVKYGPRW